MCVCDFSCPFLLGWGQRDGMLAGFLLKVYGLVVVVAVVARWCWYWDGWWWVEVVGGGWGEGGGVSLELDRKGGRIQPFVPRTRLDGMYSC